jgi:Xaa-Pro aminopeptidase
MLRLLYAASEHDADMLYATGFFAPDPFLCLTAGSRTILVMSDLEMDRAKRESKATDVWSWTQMAKRAGASGPPTRTEHVIAACLNRIGVRSAEVPGSFPLGLARRLEALKIRLRVVHDPFWPAREIKTRNEVKKIEASLRAAEAGLLAGIEALKATRVGRDGFLWSGRSKFTSEDLRGVVDGTILKLGGIPVRTICAGGDQAVDPHEVGHGPLRAHSPIVMDIFPRSQATGYFGMKSGRMQGFFHGTGHGLGLEIHEAPSISRRGSILRAGHVVTVEPGLYYLGIGGVRIEDVALVTKTGSRNLTRVPKVLEI